MQDKLGRFMSLIALAEVGLTLLSRALAGILADLDVVAMYVLAGSLLALVATVAAISMVKFVGREREAQITNAMRTPPM